MPGIFHTDLLEASGAILPGNAFVAVGFGDIVWTLLAVVVFFVGLLLITIILLQDSKDAGLTSAFGGGGGGSALLGARMQKGLAKLTTMLAIFFAVSVMIMGIIGNSTRERSIGEGVEPNVQSPPVDGAVDPGGVVAPEGGGGGEGDQ